VTNKEIAEQMQRKGSEYLRDFPLPCLTSWVRDRKPDGTVACAYCGSELLSGSPGCFRMGSVDHVLPKQIYEWLTSEESNFVPCCQRCNSTKWRFDGNAKEPIYDRSRDGDKLTDQQRIEFVRRATAHLQVRREELHTKTWNIWQDCLNQSAI
jgi:hypothetical protein